jgi:cytochrome c
LETPLYVLQRTSKRPSFRAIFTGIAPGDRRSRECARVDAPPDQGAKGQMDSFEYNKLIGAFLGVVFVAFSVSIVSDTIFAAHAPHEPGYPIEALEPEAGGEAPAEEEVSILALLPEADPAAGEAVFRKCAACHTAEQGGANKVGPNLWGVVGRPVASHEGFSYSAAMQEFSQGGSVNWTFEHLSQFLRSPRDYVEGTAMAFAGIKNPEEEANLLAYLRSLSEDPVPLPEAPAEEAAAPADGEEGAAAEDGAAPAEGEAAPAEEAAPATEDAAPAGDEAAPAEGEAAPAEEPEPVEDGDAVAPGEAEADDGSAQPNTIDDGTSASPETGAGRQVGGEAAADGETGPSEAAPAEEAPASEEAPAEEERPVQQ